MLTLPSLLLGQPQKHQRQQQQQHRLLGQLQEHQKQQQLCLLRLR
jgi:hypothetical protein